MSGLQVLSRDRLIVFCRYPVPGKTKTRLITALGPIGAADLHRRLTQKTLATVKVLARTYGMGIDVCFEGGDLHKMRRWLGPNVSFSRQADKDLGERMHISFVHAFQNGCRRVVLLGTDIPELTINHLKDALTALKEKDLVLGPSTDGGYWLVGLNRPAQIFVGIDWGSTKVLEQTLALANTQGLSIHQLSPLTDMDTENDLKAWPSKDPWQRPYLSVIIPTLNEETTIETAMGTARDPDAEIIVVDGGSTDHTVSRALNAGARVERSPRGRALQQNLGAAAAHGNVLLFLHADTRLPKGYSRHVFETLMDREIIIGAFRFKSDLVTAYMKGIEFVTNFRSRYLHLPYGDQGLFIRKRIFEALGGFPQVPIAEDLFFVRQLSKKGRVGIAPVDATTSARRWIVNGMLRTTWINQLIVLGCYLGVSPHVLASLYRSVSKK